MVETKVPKDVRAYKTKIIGPFTMRQLICIAAAVAFDFVLYLIVTALDVHLNMRLVIYGLVFINLPILAFMLEIQGMPLEQYLSKVALANFVKPTKRKMQNLLYEDQKKKPLTSKEKKNREKLIAHIGHKNPELKAFK